MQQTCLGFRQSFTSVLAFNKSSITKKKRDLQSQSGILANYNHTLWKDQLPSVRFAMSTARSQSTDDVQRDFRSE